MNFDDLFADMPRYNSLREIKPLKKLFNILSGEESVRKMIEANDIAKRPAICGVIKFIEKFCDRHSGEGLNIDAEKEIGPDGRAALTEKGRKAVFLRRFIGAMINAIMGNNGYTIKKGQKIIGGGLSKYFSSGARFGNPSKAGEGRELGRSGARKRSVKAQREASGRKETTRRRKTAQAGNRLVLTEAEIAGFIAEAFQTAAAASAGAVYEKGGRDEKFTYISDGFISYPFSETVLAYSRLHYMSAYQIACEIELNHPGIVEMTGMSFMPDIDEGPENGVKDELNQLDLRLENDMFTTNRDKSFVDTIQDFLVRECAQNIGAEKRRHAAIEGGGGFEMAVLANYFEPEGTIFRNCDLEYFRPERKFLLFRPCVSCDAERELSMRLSERVSAIDTRYSSLFFNKFHLEGLIGRALEKAFSEFQLRGGMRPAYPEELPVFLTLNQLKKKLFEIAENFGFEMPYNFDGYPVYAIFLELLKERRLPFIVKFMSSRHLMDLALAGYHEIEYDEVESPQNSDDEFENPERISELGNYIPLIMIKMF